MKSETEAAGLALLPDFSIALTGGRLADPLLTFLRLNPWLATAAIGAAIPIYEGGALQGAGPDCHGTASAGRRPLW